MSPDFQPPTNRLELRHYLLALASGTIAAVLVSVFWLLLAPPKVNIKTELDPKAVAEYLQPAISALKPSRSK